jgi:hypothetical protein
VCSPNLPPTLCLFFAPGMNSYAQTKPSVQSPWKLLSTGLFPWPLHMSCGQLWELSILPTVGGSMFSLLLQILVLHSSERLQKFITQIPATCVTSNLYYWPWCEKFAKITLKVGGCNNSYSTDPCWKYVSVLNPKWASKLCLSLRPNDPNMLYTYSYPKSVLMYLLLLLLLEVFLICS